MGMLCGNAWTDRAVIWGGEWVWPRHWRIRWGSICLKWKWRILGLFAPIDPMVSKAYFWWEMYLMCAWKGETISIRTIYLGNIFSAAFWKYSQVQDRCGGLRNICKNLTLISGTDHCIFGHSSKASSVPWNIVSHWKVSLRQITWQNKSAVAILLSYNIHRGVNMFLPPRNKVSVDDNALHVQFGELFQQMVLASMTNSNTSSV